MEKQKPYIAAILIQCSLAGMSLFSKAAMSAKMKPCVFVAYRHAFATLALLPFVFVFRSEGSPLTWIGFAKLFVSSCGLGLAFNLSTAGFEYISATFGAAVLCITPVFVFIIAVCLRMENVAITQRHGMAKVLGTILSLCGTMAYTFYKGPPLFSKDESHHSFEKSLTKQQWIKGSFLAISGQGFYAMWLTMQAPLLRKYPGKLRLTFLQNGFSCITTVIYCVAMERNISSWKLGWNISLLSVAYCGVVVAGMAYTLQAWVIEKKGPVFTAIFNPFAVIIAAILSALFLKETLHWGSVLGAALLIAGLYSFLWGKNQESQTREQKQLNHSTEEPHNEGTTTSISPDEAHEKEAQRIK